jgi:histone-lysine N-methyltransferase SETMAR
MLIVFWGIHGITHYYEIPKESTVDSPFFCEEALSASSARSENAAKFRKIRKPLTLIHMDNAKVHTATATQGKLDVSGFKRTPQPPYSPDIAPSDFSLFG